MKNDVVRNVCKWKLCLGPGDMGIVHMQPRKAENNKLFGSYVHLAQGFGCWS